MKRRNFVLATGATMFAGPLAGHARWLHGVGGVSPMNIAGDLLNPPAYQSVDGVLDVNLTVAMGRTVLPQGAARLRLYQGGIPAPSWLVAPGDTLRVLLKNLLPPNPDADDHSGHSHVMPNKLNTTNLHVHGFHVSPTAPSDDVFQEIEPGETYQYEYDIPADHPVGTYWYHPHRHGSVAVQIASGMAGMIAIENPNGRPDMVERHLVVQSPMVGPDGELNDPAQFMSLGAERYFLINGQYQPRIYMNAGETQYWRVLHANDSQFMPLDFDQIPGLEVQIIARDGNPLPAPLPVKDVTLSPGNRLDLLVTATQVGIFDFGRASFDQGLVKLPAAVLGQLVVQSGDKRGSMPPVPPENGPPDPIRDDEIVATKRFTLGTQHNPDAVFETAFTINGHPYDPDKFVTAKLGTAEAWEFVNLTPFPHPIHIHVNPFQVVEIDGVAQADRPWMDTVMVPPAGTLKLLTRFEDFAGDFVMHCHILPHEDAGMMMNVRIEE